MSSSKSLLQQIALKKKLQKMARGGDPKKTPSIGQPTAQDSLNLYHNAKDVENYYRKSGNYKEQMSYPINDFLEVEENHRTGRRSSLSTGSIMRNGDKFTTNDVVKQKEYYLELDDNRYAQRETANSILDLRSPISFFDKRITPSAYTQLINKNPHDKMFGDLVEIYEYDPIAVKPWSMSTPAEKKIKVEKYGFHPTNGTPPAETSKSFSTYTKAISAKPAVPPFIPKTADRLESRSPNMSDNDLPIRENNFQMDYSLPNMPKMDKFYVGMDEKQEARRKAGKPYQALNARGHIINVVSGDLNRNKPSEGIKDGGKERIGYDEGQGSFYEKGGSISYEGYRRDSPHRNRPMNLIPSNRISMSEVDHPVIGSDGIETRMMFPGEEHQFANPMVTEIPVKGLFANMINDMRANGTLPGGGKPKALLDDGTPARVYEKPQTSQQMFDSFMVAHPEMKGTKWEVEARKLLKEHTRQKEKSVGKSSALVFQEGGELDEHQAFLKNWYENRQIPDDYIQEAYELDKPAYLEKAKSFAPYVNVDEIDNDPNITGRYESKNNRVLLTPRSEGYVKTHEQNHYMNHNGSGEYMRTIHDDIVKQEVTPREAMFGEYYDHYDQIADPDEVHSRIMVLREQAGIKPDQVVDEKFLDNFFKQYDGKNTNINDLIEISKSKGALLNMLNYMASNEKPLAKSTARKGGEMNKNVFLNTLARIAAKKTKVPMDSYPTEKGEDVLEYLQQGGQVPQEIINMYLDQQSQDHWGQATTGFQGAIDNLLGSAYQTQRDKVRVEDFDPRIQTAQNGAEVPAYIKRNRYRGFVPNFQKPIDLHYEGREEGLSHPGVIAPIDWGQSTLGSYDVKYRNPIWGKNVKRREHYEFYTPYGRGSGNTPQVNTPGVQRPNAPVPSMEIDESPYRARPHVNLDYASENTVSEPFQVWQDPDSLSNFNPSTGEIVQPDTPVTSQMSLAEARRTLKKYDYLLDSPEAKNDPRAASVRKAKKIVSKYDYLRRPLASKNSNVQTNMRPRMSTDETDQMLIRRENEYRQLSKKFKEGGSVEDRLKIANEFYKKGGEKC